LLIDDDCERWLREGGDEVINGRDLIDSRDHMLSQLLTPQVSELLEAGAKNVWLAPTGSGESLIVELPDDADVEQRVIETYCRISASYEIEKPERFVGERYAELSILL
jgi:hypothetical protein